MGRPVICLDFDGVVHSYMSGWKGARNIPDPPVEGVFAFIATMLSYGYDVVIHSSRARHFGGIWAMRRWLKKHAGAMWYDGMGEGMEAVRFVRWKPPAVLTLDDRAVTFDGTWPSLETIKGFKPWNKK
jgi:hypothetical protein